MFANMLFIVAIAGRLLAVPLHCTIHQGCNVTCASACLSITGVTDGVMVVLEEGTEEGFDAVRKLRQSVLDLEARHLAREERKQQEGQPAAEADKDQPSGAHVVAPCPHDKICPLTVSNTGLCACRQRCWP